MILVANTTTRERGFTVIELMLSMAFVSVLIIAIAMITIQMTNIYNKGITLRAVQQAGQTVIQDMQTTIIAAQPLDVGATGGGGLNYKPMVQIGGSQTKPDGGRLCTGTYSYVWNTGYGLSNPVNRYQSDQGEIRMVKVRDVGAAYCNDITTKINAPDAVELLSAGDRELAIQTFKIVPVATDAATGQALYLVTLELGTNDQSSLVQDLNTIDTLCKPPSDNDSARDFCAVNKFEFTVRAGNRGDS